MAGDEMGFALFLVVTTFLLTLLLTGMVRRYAIRRAILDVPNHRSSHSEPVPRGGGVAIVAAIGMALAAIMQVAPIPDGVATALVGGGGAVALIGWFDDRYTLSAGLRAVVHLLAAAWALVAVVGVDRFARDPGGSLLAILFIAWLTNLYNFMDGADGVAGTETICAGLVGAVLLAFHGQPGLALLSLATAAAAAGFLVWNWPPARIFMGDVGSCFLGFSFGVLALAGEKVGAVPLLIWIVVLGVFFWDASFTLIRRVLAGEPWYAAHRTHAYQRLIQLGWSHRRVALAVLAGNVLLMPFVWAASIWDNGIVPIVAGSALLCGAAWWTIQRHHRKKVASR
jgi:Fuc2NAc and GlcNAc transferase